MFNHISIFKIYVSVKHIFRGEVDLSYINQTNITLVPKTQHSKKVEDFRPISCSNVIYKIIVKVLINRLKLVLTSVVDPIQATFVPYRIIQDNLIIGQECAHWTKMRRPNAKSHYDAIKLDMQKAYGRVEWDFLIAVLQKKGFHPTWVERINKCI